jgi:hypothetical protein
VERRPHQSAPAKGAINGRKPGRRVVTPIMLWRPRDARAVALCGQRVGRVSTLLPMMTYHHEGIGFGGWAGLPGHVCGIPCEWHSGGRGAGRKEEGGLLIGEAAGLPG